MTNQQDNSAEGSKNERRILVGNTTYRIHSNFKPTEANKKALLKSLKRLIDLYELNH